MSMTTATYAPEDVALGIMIVTQAESMEDMEMAERFTQQAKECVGPGSIIEKLNGKSKKRPQGPLAQLVRARHS